MASHCHTDIGYTHEQTRAIAVHRENGAPYDYHRLLYTIRVTSRLKEAGIFRPPHRWTFNDWLGGPAYAARPCP